MAKEFVEMASCETQRNDSHGAFFDANESMCDGEQQAERFILYKITKKLNKNKIIFKNENVV